FPMATARVQFTMTLLQSGLVLAAGGGTNTATTNTTELFESMLGSFGPSSTMTTRRFGHTATLLKNGQVLVAGGQGLASAEILGLVATGSACATATDCVSGECNENCCASACSGVCMTCEPATGACVPVKGAMDPDSCAGTGTCDATGACVTNTVC